jgi:hypothetical protein
MTKNVLPHHAHLAFLPTDEVENSDVARQAGQTDMTPIVVPSTLAVGQAFQPDSVRPVRLESLTYIRKPLLNQSK